MFSERKPRALTRQGQRESGSESAAAALVLNQIHFGDCLSKEPEAERAKSSDGMIWAGAATVNRPSAPFRPVPRPPSRRARSLLLESRLSSVRPSQLASRESDFSPARAGPSLIMNQ
jgi:hypothetical protein